jgi:hypothetical protein
MVCFLKSFCFHVLRSLRLAPAYDVATDGNHGSMFWTARSAERWAEREVLCGRATSAYVGVASWFDWSGEGDTADPFGRIKPAGLLNVFSVISKYGDCA